MRQSACPRLTFDVVDVCKREMKHLSYAHVWQFVREVDGVLREHHGKVVETLQVRINLENRMVLAPHIDNWVAFAAASRTKSLALDLQPAGAYDCRYVFPFQLFDRQSSISCRLQHLQLSFVSLEPPSQFRGFPNLRKLHLQNVQVTRKDLEHVLSHCSCTLEWLAIARCRLLDDHQLAVDTPLPRLLYLRVQFCSTKIIRFNAANLATFEYHGHLIPIDLVQSSKLQGADIKLLYRDAIFHRVLISLLNGLPSVQSLTLDYVRVQTIEVPLTTHVLLIYHEVYIFVSTYT